MALRVSSLALARGTHFAPGKYNTARLVLILSGFSEWPGARGSSHCESPCQENCHVTTDTYRLVISSAASRQHWAKWNRTFCGSRKMESRKSSFRWVILRERITKNQHLWSGFYGPGPVWGLDPCFLSSFVHDITSKCYHYPHLTDETMEVPRG